MVVFATDPRPTTIHIHWRLGKRGRVKEKFEERVMKVCGESLYDQSGIGREEGKEERRELEQEVMWLHGVKGEKGKGFFIFFILRHGTEGIVGKDIRRVEVKVEKIEIDGNKEKK